VGRGNSGQSEVLIIVGCLLMSARSQAIEITLKIAYTHLKSDLPSKHCTTAFSDQTGKSIWLEDIVLL
jgi:hypothetical protein